MKMPYQYRWSEKDLSLDIFTHEIFSYRYNWHETEYEVNILIHGKAELCCAGTVHILEEDDVLLIPPGVPHASFSLEPDTISLVLHFSTEAFKPYIEPGCGFAFPSCISCAETRNLPGFVRLRFCAAEILLALAQDGPFADLTARAGLEMFLSTLCTMFSPEIVPAAPEPDSINQEAIRRITDYLKVNYASKITLADLADFTGYNRTYLSGFFKANLGMNFYEYLTHVRLRNAAFDLGTTSKTLTEVAIDNGFPDLRTFNTRFHATFSKTPTEYRASIVPGHTTKSVEPKRFLPVSHPIVHKKCAEYLN